jgi:hypothetical protein
MSAIFPVVATEHAEKAVKQFRGIVFPEEAINDVMYVKKAKEMMQRLINVDVRVKPINTTEERDFRRL